MSVSSGTETMWGVAMVRLNRAQQQQRTRAAVRAAAHAEFAEHGYTEARVDRIAERAELTRGAVYSNFPSKRALYLAVLLDIVERDGPEQRAAEQAPAGVTEPAAALGAFARVWLERLPLFGDTPAHGHLQLRSLTGVLDDEPARTALAQLTRLESLLFALALESCARTRSRVERRVRLAELVLTLLDGVGHLAESAAAFGDPFDVAAACEHLDGLDLPDIWDPPYLPFVTPAEPCRDAWTPPPDVSDQISGRPIGLGSDGVLAVLGTQRLAAAEEAVRAARPGDRVTVVVVTADHAEVGRLVRLRLTDIAGSLRRVFAPIDQPRLRVVVDDGGLIAAAADVPDPDDATEAAVRIKDGAIIARAQGRGAAHAAATAAAGGGTQAGT
ncbi:TetR/AcrR family transcriptional regulator [Pseudonocardia sp. GCM10023141]|uniref:TetR/AcrR family transcriptional regulator n=1 Tax=Pseudonocardia sp. GCM10023141 TaxID=3252653 RepID=UPI00360B6FDE